MRNLQRHQKKCTQHHGATRTVDLPEHKCSCGANFAYKRNLVKHKLKCNSQAQQYSKSQIKGTRGKCPFLCKVPSCGSSFATKFNLERHISSRHTEAKFLCNLCGKSWTRKSKYQQHQCSSSHAFSPNTSKQRKLTQRIVGKVNS